MQKQNFTFTTTMVPFRGQTNRTYIFYKHAQNIKSTLTADTMLNVLYFVMQSPCNATIKLFLTRRCKYSFDFFDTEYIDMISITCNYNFSYVTAHFVK